MEQNNEVLSENSTEEPNSDGQIITSNHSIKTVKSLSTFVGEHLSSFLFIISASGVLIQIIELSSIHISYLRFFSVTQIPSDAALILIPVSVFLLTNILYNFILPSKYFDYSHEKYIENTFKQLFIKTFPLAIIVIVLGYGYFREENILENPMTTLILFSSYLGLLYILVNYLFITFITFTRGFKDSGRIINRKAVLTVFTIVALAISNYRIGEILPRYLNTQLDYYEIVFRDPYLFVNKGIAESKILEEYQGIKKINIVYFNDTYTIVQVLNPAFKGKYNNHLVLKTDDIMY